MILMGMGFEEMPTNRWVESSFWNFDALFQPQSHPARDAHDTFFLKGDAKETKSVPEDYYERVKAMHQKGNVAELGLQGQITCATPTVLCGVVARKYLATLDGFVMPTRTPTASLGTGAPSQAPTAVRAPTSFPGGWSSSADGLPSDDSTFFGINYMDQTVMMVGSLAVLVCLCCCCCGCWCCCRWRQKRRRTQRLKASYAEAYIAEKPRGPSPAAKPKRKGKKASVIAAVAGVKRRVKRQRDKRQNMDPSEQQAPRNVGNSDVTSPESVTSMAQTSSLNTQPIQFFISFMDLNY